jgi:hypothetical protein
MNTRGIALALVLFGWGGTGFSQIAAQEPEVLLVPDGNARQTYFTIHGLSAAQMLSRGAGVRVGILDHFFDLDHHADLYAGGENFLPGRDEWLRSVAHHGYWMATVLRDVAPDARIYALNTGARDEAEKAQAIARAIDWAIAHHLQVLTYSDAAFSPANRPVVDEAVRRAHRAGIVTTFIHYPLPENLLPGWIGPRTGDDGREPDLNILQYDYSRVFVDKLRGWQNGEARDPSRHPFLSLSSTSAVTAGMVALLLAADSTLQPDAVKALLVKTSRPYKLDGRTGTRVPNANAALEALRRPQP